MKKLLSILLVVLFTAGAVSQVSAEPMQTAVMSETIGKPAEEQPAEEPTEQPTEGPAEQPTEGPAEQPTEGPTEQPTEGPAEQPTEEPAEQPTEGPTEEPTAEPAAGASVKESTPEPSGEPTADPSIGMTPAPEPTEAPAETKAPSDIGYITIQEGDWRIVMGADLTSEQRAQIFNVFGVKGEADDSKLLTVTNAEERFYFKGKLPIEEIGTRSLSCIYIKALKKGKGLKIETHNIDYCTPEMYINVLTTVGITDAEIIVASPVTVSGTAALTGVYKAYESLTGDILSEYAKLAGIDELLATGELAKLIGSDEATEIINELKKILDETQHMDDEAVRQKIREIAYEYGVELTETEVNQILTLSRTLEGLDVEQIRQRALGLVNAANGWEKFTKTVVNTVEKINDFFKEIVQFFKELFEKWFA